MPSPQLDQLVIDSAVEKREMERKHAAIQQRVRPCSPISLNRRGCQSRDLVGLVTIAILVCSRGRGVIFKLGKARLTQTDRHLPTKLYAAG